MTSSSLLLSPHVSEFLACLFVLFLKVDCVLFFIYLFFTYFPVEELDREWLVDKPAYIVWSIGSLDHAGEPAFHRLHHVRDVALNLDQNPPVNDCFNFTV